MLAGIAFADRVADVPPSLPKLISVTMSGNGCSGGSSVIRGTDNMSFTMVGFNVYHANGSKAIDRSRNCQAHINLGAATEGWQVAMAGVRVHGYANVSAGGTLVTSIDTYWSTVNSTVNTTPVSLIDIDMGPANAILRAH